jgi:hypothetical protein
MQGGHRILLTGKTGIASATIAADGPTSLSTIEMRGLLFRIDHSRLRLLDALSTLLDWENPLGEGMSTEWKISMRYATLGRCSILVMRSNSLKQS